MLTEKDIDDLGLNGFTVADIEEQVGLLERGDIYQPLFGPATVGNGILRLTEEQERRYVDLYDLKSSSYTMCKFVPASGAATRMFKRLVAFDKSPSETTLHDGDFLSVRNTFANLPAFAFSAILGDLAVDDLDDVPTVAAAARQLLSREPHLTTLPKGLVPFHAYGGGRWHTAFEEHFHEMTGMSNDMQLHFTIGKDFEDAFTSELARVEQALGRNFDVSFSYQDKSTDTVSLYDDDGTLVRDAAGRLMLRPGGHGALLRNLNAIEADIIFIKNIDNVPHNDYLPATIKYKKMLCGVLLEVVERLHSLHGRLLAGELPSAMHDDLVYVDRLFGTDFALGVAPATLRAFLERPVRVCGMVSNEGEPGGGPFWVKSAQHGLSLQIVERSQVDLLSPEQRSLFDSSTHFNPVDLVCYTRKPDGGKYNLPDYADTQACFISSKTYGGRDIRVLERPGLWNGSMANWLTVFVEVPLITFNPVKELNDLLRKEHKKLN